MEIKKIKLSAKRGGNGYVSSYSVNIGSNEARTCGLVSAEHPILLCKVVDDENEQIIIKPKRYTLTNETVQSVISTADQLRKISDLQLGSVPCVIQGIIDVSDIPEPDEDVRRAEAELERVLMDLSYEEVTDLVTLMLIGREDDADMTLEGPERFLDYWGYLSERGVFNAKESLVDYMVEKMPLPEYLRKGLEILENLRVMSPTSYQLLYSAIFIFGAGDRTRTGTVLLPGDFKSPVSTIPPHRQLFGNK